MARIINKIKNSQDGVAAIEFALILPVLLLIIFGIIEFGLLLFNKQVITNASREGARYGIIIERPSVPEIISEVDDYCKDYLISLGADNSPNTSVSKENKDKIIVGSSSCGQFGDSLIVRTTYDHEFLLLPVDPVTLAGRTVMKCE